MSEFIYEAAPHTSIAFNVEVDIKRYQVNLCVRCVYQRIKILLNKK
jgi:hypothetical protein